MSKPKWTYLRSSNRVYDELGWILADLDGSDFDFRADARHGRLFAAAPELLEALESCPLPSVGSQGSEFYSRFYDWWETTAKPAIARAKGGKS